MRRPVPSSPLCRPRQGQAGARDGAGRRTRPVGLTTTPAFRGRQQEPYPMATSTSSASRAHTENNHRGAVRRSTETKAAFKKTELIAYVVEVVGVLVAALVVDEATAGGRGARQAWLYVTILTVGYMISRGLAKSGSRDPYTDDVDR